MDNKIRPTLSTFGKFLSKLSENSDHVYWLSSHDFKKIQYISPAYEKIWGRTRDDLYLYPESWITFIHPEDQNRKHPINDMAEQVARLGEAARFSISYRIIRPDGEVRWIMDKGFPIYDDNGVCCGVTGVAVDVTEEKKYEEELKKAKERAEAANKAKVLFIENMSHDIRTPLSGVIGMSNLLINGLKDNPQHQQYAQWINDSGEQLLQLLNGILDVISADTINEHDVNKEFFDFRQCIKDIIELEMPTAYLKGLDLNLNIDDAIPQYVYSDRIKVHRIILNLLGNAIKFTEQGQVSILAQLLELNKQQAVIHFSVKDTGIGISKEQQDKVFDRFHKVTPSHKGLYSGYGVGLHIVLTYVKLLGGDIQLTSTPGMGTVFDFNLTFECLSDDLLQTKVPSPKQEQKPFVTNKSCHLLLVEDNTVALKVAETVAMHAGCHVVSAKDAEQAYVLMQSTDFDLVLTDIGLPGMSGYDLTQLIREHELVHNKKPVPVIGLTAHSKVDAEQDSAEAGMNEVYCKPITAELMNQILITHVFQDDSSISIGNKAGSLGYDLPANEAQLFALEHFPLLDINKAVGTVGNEHLVRQVLELMISDEIKKDIDVIRAAHTKGDWDEIEKFAHKMKGGAVYIGTVKMQYACQYLERYQKAGFTSLLEPLYQQLITVVNDTQDYIRAWLTKS